MRNLKSYPAPEFFAHPIQKKYYDLNVIKASQAFGIHPQEYKDDGIINNSEFGKGRLSWRSLTHPVTHLTVFVFTLQWKSF